MSRTLSKLGLQKNPKTGNVTIKPWKNVFAPEYGSGPRGPYQGHSSRTRSTSRRKRKS